jgi:hypothetical protein
MKKLWLPMRVPVSYLTPWLMLTPSLKWLSSPMVSGRALSGL